MSELPIACSLDPAQLAERREGLLPGLAALALGRETLPDGFRWRFAASGDLLGRVARVVDAERQCCPFLRFELTVEQAGGPMWLAVTGPAGTRELLEAITRE